MRVHIIVFFVIFGFFLHMCHRPSEPETKDIPREEIPHFVYQKLGKNWFKLPTGSLNREAIGMAQKPPNNSNSNEWLKDLVTPYTFKRFLFLRPQINSSAKYYFPELYDSLNERKHRIDFISLHWLALEPEINHLCVPTSGQRWVEFTRDYEVLTSRKESYDCVRSKDPVYFDQHVYMRGLFRKQDDWIEVGHIRRISSHSRKGESKFPYFSAEIFLSGNPRDRNVSVVNDRLNSPARHIHSIVEHTFLGPELPEEISKMH